MKLIKQFILAILLLPLFLKADIYVVDNTVNEANLIKDELEAQHKRKEFISIQKLAILKAKDDGMKKGMEKGIKQEKIEIAKKSLSQRLITGLTNEQVLNI